MLNPEQIALDPPSAAGNRTIILGPLLQIWEPIVNPELGWYTVPNSTGKSAVPFRNETRLKEYLTALSADNARRDSGLVPLCMLAYISGGGQAIPAYAVRPNTLSEDA